MALLAVGMGCEPSNDRTAACKTMLDYGFANFALVSPQPETATVPVKLGHSSQIAAIPEAEAQLLVDKAKKDGIATETVLEKSVTAPVNQGQRIGTMTVKSGDQILAEVPLVAADSVPRLTWWDITEKVLRQVAMANA